MRKLETMPFNITECLDDIQNRLGELIRVCDSRSMDERLARELVGMIHELSIVKESLKSREDN